MTDRRDELKKIIADLEHDLKIVRRTRPRKLAVIRDLEFMLVLAQSQLRHVQQGRRR